MKKIALLFITIDNHNKPDIWNKFLNNTELFNIYCHPKNPENVTDSFLKSNIIPDLRETKWGHLVLAYYAQGRMQNLSFYNLIFFWDFCFSE